MTQRLNFLSEAKERLTQEVKEKGGSSESELCRRCVIRPLYEKLLAVKDYWYMK